MVELLAGDEPVDDARPAGQVGETVKRAYAALHPMICRRTMWDCGCWVALSASGGWTQTDPLLSELLALETNLDEGLRKSVGAAAQAGQPEASTPDEAQGASADCDRSESEDDSDLEPV